MGVNSNRVEAFSTHQTTLTVKVSVPMPPSMEVHTVCLPPQTTTFQKLKHRVSEIFFPEDPLHRFKNQTWCTKLLLGLQFFFPIFQWGSEYNLSLFRSDIISGLTIASLAIPQVIYTKLPNYLFLFIFAKVFNKLLETNADYFCQRAFGPNGKD